LSSPAIIDGNWIGENDGPGDHSAVCISEVSTPITVTNNIITENTGIGIRLTNNQSISLVNNTIMGNSLRGVQVLLPSLDQDEPPPFRMHNNIVANNGECVFIENRQSGDGLHDVSGSDTSISRLPISGPIA
jgi:parallel beta-helix repeat protein